MKVISTKNHKACHHYVPLNPITRILGHPHPTLSLRHTAEVVLLIVQFSGYVNLDGHIELLSILSHRIRESFTMPPFAKHPTGGRALSPSTFRSWVGLFSSLCWQAWKEHKRQERKWNPYERRKKNTRNFICLTRALLCSGFHFRLPLEATNNGRRWIVHFCWRRCINPFHMFRMTGNARRSGRKHCGKLLVPKTFAKALAKSDFALKEIIYLISFITPWLVFRASYSVSAPGASSGQ